MSKAFALTFKVKILKLRIEIPGRGISWSPTISLLNVSPIIFRSILTFTGFLHDSIAIFNVSGLLWNWSLHSMVVPEIEQNPQAPGIKMSGFHIYALYYHKMKQLEVCWVTKACTWKNRFSEFNNYEISVWSKLKYIWRENICVAIIFTVEYTMSSV